MRNLFFTVFFSAILVVCYDPKPIEKYYGHDYVVVDINSNGLWIKLKNKDTIFRADLLKFDMKNLKIGDTLR